MKKIKKLLSILIILLLIPVVSSDTLYYEYQDLELALDIHSTIKLVPTSTSSSVNIVTAKVKFVPENDYRQTIINLDTLSEPKASIISKYNDVEFQWNSPEEEELFFQFKSKIKTRANLRHLSDQINMPLNIQSKNVMEYTEATQYITLTPQITKQANEIVKDETDLYVIASELAIWVKENVEYDLSTLTADVTQSSTWVLENRRGVCDELTNLFISFLRSQGIPARFVSGTVYSNTDGTWSPHGWAEVYFPDKGWLPFDPTFGQYGWIDATHLKLSDSQDPNEGAVLYHWISKNIELQPDKLEIETTPITQGKKIPPLIQMKVTPLIKQSAHESYIPIQVTVLNPEPYYISPEVFLTKAPGIEGSSFKGLSLKPKEVKNVYFLLKLPNDLDNTKRYTVTIEVDSLFGYPAATIIDVDNTFDKISEQIAQQQIQEAKSKPAANFQIEETTNYDQIELSELEDLGFNLGNPENLNSEPKITNFQPSEIEYNQETDLSFTLDIDSEIRNIELDLKGITVLSYDDISEDTTVTISTNTKKLVNGIQAKITYEDINGNKYETIEQININVINTPFYAKILNKIRTLFY